MFFPCSSSTSSANYDPMIPISATNNITTDDHHMGMGSSQVYNYFDGRDRSSNGLLGLRSSAENLVGREVLINKDHHQYLQQQYSDLTTTARNKNKGEKKTRKPKYAFQTRSQVDILDDGYRWRKYGQKAVKNNKFPRSYYRCTYQGCNVKKQVQRLTKDEGIVVTTYEGMHTHPIEKPSDNFEHILNQMQIYTPF
ncbi:putative WRKY transcription factor 45 [Prunus yedoensis var. nudiflora]|uniref:Putative WRKY transcription factor 45 n=1 Tax=Prunus yedoensis var. nudiflora TaxID=2094558 RepID=A0A314XPR8_PRUYE|nr:putative WRKY transcription factor 45 [Prunus yedoensis var. nudiflora]